MEKKKEASLVDWIVEWWWYRL